MKKLFAIVVGFLLLGMAVASAQEKTQTQAQEKAQVRARTEAQTKAQTTAQSKVQTRSEFRNRLRVAFIDEDGDGISDLARDADGDGIPNCQDPDWSRPGDGSGYRGRSGQGAGSGTASGYAYQLTRDDDGDGIPNGKDADWTRPLDGSGAKAQHKFAKGAFRSGAMTAAQKTGAGVCDGTGPKGGVSRKGRR